MVSERVRRGVVSMLAALSLVLVTPVAGWAHATLVSSEPAAKGRLSTSPPRVRLVFSEALEPSLGRITIVGSDGLAVKLAAAGDPHDVNALVAPVGSLAPGAYRVQWRVVSADGHPVEGSFTFSIDAPADTGTARRGVDSVTATVAAPSPAPPAPTHDMGAMHDAANPGWGPTFAGAPIIPSVLRGLALGTLMAAAGLLGFLSLGRAATDPSPRRAERIAGWLAVAAAVLLVLHHAAWALNALPEHELGADMLAAMLSTGAGRVELLRSALALLAAWGIVLARRPRLALPFAIAALLVSGATGHPEAIQPLWTIPAKALHLVAGAVWLGGLLWLLLADRAESAWFERETSRVSAASLVAVVVVALSGLLQTFLFLPSPLDLVRSSYGLVALAKVAGLLVLVAFGAHHRFRVLPRLAGDASLAGGFVVTLRREVVVMAVVILLGGLLAYVAPPSDAPPSPHTLAP